MKNISLSVLVVFLFFGCSNNSIDMNNDNVEVFTNHQSEFLVKGMMCERGCSSYLKNKISEYTGVVNCNIDFSETKLLVDYNNEMVSSDELIAFVNDLNNGQYSLELLSDKTITNANTENNLSNSQEDEINVVDFGFQLPNLTHLFTNWL